MTDAHYRCYIPRKFSQDNLDAIVQANKIIEEYAARGWSLTLRQLYYQHVARGLLENSGNSYSKLGGLINDGRLAGLISWVAIEDRTRSLHGLNNVSGPGEALAKAREDFRLDLWATQPWRPEVWVEKEALAEVVAHICSELRVDYFPCRGYVSQSEQWRAGRRLANYYAKGQLPIVFHLGDHDPSGIDMTRDNQERLSLFAGTQVQVIRLALNMDQILLYKPPPNPAKVTDARFARYQVQYGDESWELDALDPDVIHTLIRQAVERLRDPKLWDEALKAEVEDKLVLDGFMEEIGED